MNPQGDFNPYEIRPSSPERRGQRKLRRMSGVSRTQAITSLFEPRSSSSPHGSKPHSSPYTLEEISNRLNAPNKLTRKSLDNPAPSRWYQTNSSSPVTHPGSHHTSYSMKESHTTYSESYGELQRQFAISQRLQRKSQTGSPSPTDVGAYLGGLKPDHDGDGWVDGFRLDVEKPLRRVYAQRLQQGNRSDSMIPEKSKKVRFASVIECAEF